jgi:hypothetical protein
VTATGSSCCQTAGSWSVLWPGSATVAHDYERHARKPAAFVRLAMIRLMLRRLKGNPFPEPLLQLTKGLLKEGIFILTTRSNMRCSAMADVYTRPLAEVERAYVLQVLHDCYGNRTRAAKLLGISIRGLRIKLSDFAKEGFSVPAPRRSGGGHRVPGQDRWALHAEGNSPL